MPSSRRPRSACRRPARRNRRLNQHGRQETDRDHRHRAGRLPGRRRVVDVAAEERPRRTRRRRWSRPPRRRSTSRPLPPVNLPPLDQMDGFLRPLLSALSSRPELARWLATDDLVRQLAMAIDQAATGASPARDFKVIAPTTPFVPAGRGLRRTIDPASYRRYDGLVQTVTSIDASSVAKIYKTIHPRLNEAYRSLGNPDQRRRSRAGPGPRHPARYAGREGSDRDHRQRHRRRAGHT